MILSTCGRCARCLVGGLTRSLALPPSLASCPSGCRPTVVERLPISLLGKLDRRNVQAWVEAIGETINAELALSLQHSNKC